jgi:predicted secreted hydrolase
MLAALGLPARASTLPPTAPFAAANPAYRMHFPRDHGSHPEFRIEWWYITGWLHAKDQDDCGFQVTFFRVRPRVPADNPSRFNPEHIIIAHAALADRQLGKLRHLQRAARQGFGLAGSDTGNTRVWVDRWQLLRDGQQYRCRISERDMALNLVLDTLQPPLLQGVAGYSRKGPQGGSASHYYSLPHLRVSGEIRIDRTARTVAGEAWLDHEWSSSLLETDAEGWDWFGINLADGGALMAFRMRNRRGGTLWAGGSWRDAGGAVSNFKPDDIRFIPLRHWQSPLTGAKYPVSFEVLAGPFRVRLEPLMDDQENDTRATTGAVYWEGAVRARSNGHEIGRGYLELTGYLRPLQI